MEQIEQPHKVLVQVWPAGVIERFIFDFIGSFTSAMDVLETGDKLMPLQDNIQATKPLDMNDTELDPTNIDPSNLWHGDTVTYVPGLNYLTHLFYLWHSSQQTFPLSVPHIQQHMTYIQITEHTQHGTLNSQFEHA